MSEYLQNLNPEQLKAVQHSDGALLIVAGAGSGKTRVLTQRVSYLLHEKGIAPDRIVAVTFTNKAAEEMKNRIGVKMPWVGTFHALCLKILRRHIQLLGFKPGFAIFDTTDQLHLVKNILADLNYNNKQYDPRSILGSISAAKNELLDAEAYNAKAEDVYQNVVAKVYAKYQQSLKDSNAVDFDDLLFFVIQLFARFPDVLHQYQEQFLYVLVDEYQDTNHVQYLLTKYFAAKYKNICVVGDSDQNIYSWRGADIRNILDFEKDYEQVSTILLEQNYRSKKNILKIANSVIKNNMSRKEKNLWTENDDGENAQYYYAFNEHEEASYIAGQIQILKAHSKVKSYEDMAVFYRTNAQSRVIEEEFLKRDIPYRIVGGIRFYERREVKDILAYLRVINNPSDNASLMRIINVPTRGIGQISIQQLVNLALEKGLTVWNVLQNPALLPDRLKTKVAEFIKIMKDLQAEAAQTKVSKLIDKVITKSGYRQMLLESKQEDDFERLGNIQELVSIAQEKENSLTDFLAEIALMSDLRDWEAQEEAVTLMTLHSAKGLEFPVVFMTGLEEGLLPYFRSQFDNNLLEEERRLCYVGITRAKEKLFLTSAYQRRVAGDFRICEVSRFLEEIDENYLDKTESEQVKGMLLMRKSSWEEDQDWITEKSFMKKSMYEEQSKEKSYDFQQGDQVRHNMWGMGEVIKIHGEGPSMTLEVRFPKEDGVKLIMPKYAPISKC
ncbi:MAG: UvrD-helicase domain-containing protein [Candidatus Margulisbacteria bacterium]|nr:UvrD-helicase domain-containing protein [Candidatus Margulisiibacteriota bacterium]